MKILKLKSAENHSICRKLQLKDFIPTEVQRLVKYKLLFQELTKNASSKKIFEEKKTSSLNKRLILLQLKTKKTEKGCLNAWTPAVKSLST